MNLPIEPSGEVDSSSWIFGLPYLEEGIYFLRGNFLDVVAFGAEHFFPERDGGIQTLDCDAEMFDV